MATVTIDNKPYELDQLSDIVKQQLMNLQVADQKIIALQQDLALMQTARAAYARILSDNLPKE